MLALAIGAAAVAAAGLATLEAVWGGRGEHASARSTRLAAVALGDVTRQTFDFGLKSRVLVTQETDRDIALERRNAARARRSDVATALARTDVHAAVLLGEANRKVFGVRAGGRGADAQAAAVDRVLAGANRHLGAVQREAVLAEKYGRRQSRAVLGLTLVAVAGALLGLASMSGAGRTGSIALAAGGLMLLGAVAAGASSFV